MVVLDVYLAVEKKINNQTNWYGILQVNSVANEVLMKKQYKKLALMIHPQKNKSTGVEGAFKLVDKAWSVLSDELKIYDYDLKRNLTLKKMTQKPPDAPTEGYYYKDPPQQWHKADNSNAPATF